MKIIIKLVSIIQNSKIEFFSADMHLGGGGGGGGGGG